MGIDCSEIMREVLLRRKDYPQRRWWRVPENKVSTPQVWVQKKRGRLQKLREGRGGSLKGRWEGFGGEGRTDHHMILA